MPAWLVQEQHYLYLVKSTDISDVLEKVVLMEENSELHVFPCNILVNFSSLKLRQCKKYSYKVYNRRTNTKRTILSHTIHVDNLATYRAHLIGVL
jgi:hypothetical protein